MIILGIDPGLATLGYGVIRRDENGRCEMLDYGVITTPKEESLPTRLVLLEDGVNQILRLHRPDQIAFEELFFSKNITTGIAVSHARGVAMLACVKYCPYLYEYTPMQIKQALTGYGKADKKQIQEVVKMLLRLESIPRPDDAADALAIALCHATASRYGSMFKVNNMTRTKGNNTPEGREFQRRVKEQLEKEDKKDAAAKKAAVQRAKKTATTAATVAQKPKKAGAGTSASAKTVVKPVPAAKAQVGRSPKGGSAAEIAKQIAAQMQEKEKTEK